MALAAALHADDCEIYTDVEGVYTADPRSCTERRKLAEVSYDEMLEFASLGAKVLHNRSVEMAKIWREVSGPVKSDKGRRNHCEGGRPKWRER